MEVSKIVTELKYNIKYRSSRIAHCDKVLDYCLEPENDIDKIWEYFFDNVTDIILTKIRVRLHGGLLHKNGRR